MTTLRLLFVALTASTLLTSCGAFQSFDSRFPSIAQQDANDVAWGLPPRKSRGNPKLRMQYDARNESLRSAAPAPSAAVPQISPSLEPAAPAPAAPREQVAPAIPSGLR